MRELVTASPEVGIREHPSEPLGGCKVDRSPNSPYAALIQLQVPPELQQQTDEHRDSWMGLAHLVSRRVGSQDALACRRSLVADRVREDLPRRPLDSCHPAWFDRAVYLLGLQRVYGS